LTMVQTRPAMTPRVYGTAANRGYIRPNQNEGIREVTIG